MVNRRASNSPLQRPRMARVGWDDVGAGAAARSMLAQDARWIADAMLSADETAGWLPLALLGHSARVVHEGSRTVRSPNQNVGVPEAARRLTGQFEDVIARSRNGGKFLDDKRKSFEDLRADMRAFYDAHHMEFIGRAVWFAPWPERDLGIFTGPGGRVLGTTVALHFRAGLGSETRISDAGPALMSLAREQGAALAIFSTLGGDESTPTATMDYNGLRELGHRDCRALEYLDDRYEPSMDIATKLILLMVEGEVNTIDVLLPVGDSTHPEAIFRARLISLFHSVRALDAILTSQARAESKGALGVRALLSDPSTRRLLGDPGVRKVRNRCMHYEIADRAIQLEVTRPMFGIVESLCPDSSFDELNTRLRVLTRRLSDALHHWASRP